MGTGLFLLSLALSLGPLVYAFSSHDWNYKPLITPEPNPLKNIKGQPIVPESFKIDNARESATVTLTSNLPFSLRIDELSMDILCTDLEGVKLGSMSLQDPVLISPGSTESITLVLNVDEQLLRECGEKNAKFGNPTITVNGIEITLPSEGFGGTTKGS